MPVADGCAVSANIKQLIQWSRYSICFVCTIHIRVAVLSIAGSATSERDFHVFLYSEAACRPDERSDTFTRRR